MRHPIRYRLEYVIARFFWALFASLPVSAASSLGGALASVAGRLPPLARRVNKNLSLAMAELTQVQRRKIASGVWWNLGRTLAELPHIRKFSLTHDSPNPGEIQVVGAEHIDGRDGMLLFAAHLANWEMTYFVTAKLGRPLHVVYRAPNNPLIDRWLSNLRQDFTLGAYAKGRTAARGILTALDQGNAVGMLVDQKMNDGIVVPFFGRPAMTAPALAQLALRRKLPIIPMRFERLTGASFRVTLEKPLTYGDTGRRKADVIALMGQVNDMIEAWIRERPEQWLWPHKRWPNGDQATPLNEAVDR